MYDTRNSDAVKEKKTGKPLIRMSRTHQLTPQIER